MWNIICTNIPILHDTCRKSSTRLQQDWCSFRLAGPWSPNPIIWQTLVQPLQQDTGFADILAAHVAAALARARHRQGLARLRQGHPHGFPRVYQVHNGVRPDSLQESIFTSLIFDFGHRSCKAQVRSAIKDTIRASTLLPFASPTLRMVYLHFHISSPIIPRGRTTQSVCILRFIIL